MLKHDKGKNAEQFHTVSSIAGKIKYFKDSMWLELCACNSNKSDADLKLNFFVNPLYEMLEKKKKKLVA